MFGTSRKATAMSREILKDARYRVIGYIDTTPDGRQTAKDSRYRIVGYYEPAVNITKDARFRIVGHGNLLASLIRCDPDGNA
jgi:hypothetical protein